MRKVILSCLSVFIALSPVLSMAGCACQEAKPFEPNNTAIDLPEHVGYALAHGVVAVIDLDNYEVVGVQEVYGEGEWAEDFVIGPQGYLFVPINAQGGTSAKIIRVIDPAMGEIIEEIEVSKGPRMINVVSGDKAIVEHNVVIAGEDTFACDVIDMKTSTLVNTFYFGGPAGDSLSSPEGKSYICISDTRDRYGGDTLVEFDSSSDSLIGDYITPGSDFVLRYGAFVSSSKLYARMRSSEDDEGNPYGTIAVLQFPSGDLLKTIRVTWAPRSVILVDNKAYVIHYSSGSLEAAEDERTVSVINIDTDEVVKTFEVAPGPTDIAYSQATGKLYVSHVRGKISVIDPQTDEMVSTFRCDDDRITTWGFLAIGVAE